MSASRQGLRKFKRWLDLLNEQGWGDEDKKWLVDFWWEHHDDDGNIYPPGVKRSPTAALGDRSEK